MSSLHRDKQTTRSWIYFAVVLGLGAAALAWSLWPEPAQPERAAARPRAEPPGPRRPTSPPVPGVDKPAPVAEPEVPEHLASLRAEAYARAVEAGEQRPGEVAFRAMIDAFMQYNGAFAEQQAAAEGLTVAEVHELTYFGFMVLETQRWPEIEDLTESPLSSGQREQAEQLMHSTNVEFKDEMRRLVDEGAGDEERFALIADTRERYLSQYYELTGMNPDLLDELLAGDPGKPYAPADTPPPPLEEIEPAPAPPPVEPRPETRE